MLTHDCCAGGELINLLIAKFCHHDRLIPFSQKGKSFGNQFIRVRLVHRVFDPSKFLTRDFDKHLRLI